MSKESALLASAGGAVFAFKEAQAVENTYKELRTDTKLLTAALLQVRVYVVETLPFDPDELLD